MKKRFLSLLLVPLFGLAACSNGSASKAEYKKCSYFSLGGNLYVNEDGYKIKGVIASNYVLSDAASDEISGYLANFPDSIAVVEAFEENPLPIEQEHKPVESLNLVIVLNGVYKNYTLSLDEDSVTLYDTFYECYYSEGSHTAKLVEHQNVKRAGGRADYQTAYVNTGSNTIAVTSKEVEYPTSQYKFENINYPIIEQSFERYVHIGEDVPVIYTFAE